ncbi:MAG: primosomal protein N' [Candidatus Saganbacteria bacterium]|nr:primosomal protein N' [Candidatus Saganbacteria bacterium]
MYAEIILGKASRYLDKIYHYSIPSKLKNKLQIGHQVIVPFGKREDIGYVVGFVEKAEVEKVKDILEITSPVPLFSPKQVELARWLADYYCSFFITALRCVMPPGGKIPITKIQDTNKVQRPRSKGQLELTEEQEEALAEIVTAIDKEVPDKFLLYGVTGSGKTEVYMQAVAHVLTKGKSAIVMVPEIGLTPQLVQRFRDRFSDHIAVLHSDMAMKQRQKEWGRVARDEARIVLGARSAIFAPLKNLGLIVIDEEYETSYKQDKSPRYHAREVAGELARLNQAVIIMGSATPSIETYYHAERGDYKKLILSKRIDNVALPPVEIIDMCETKQYLLSKELRSELAQTLSRGEQAVLFINRRGYFTFVMCRQCGHTISCPRCEISLSYHSQDRKLRCNRCDYSCVAPVICPRCHSSSVKYFGIGTQRIENEVAQVYPAARILRWDSDSASKRGSHEVFFSAFERGEADVLIGTQMVTKGLDVAKVTLIGVVSADTALQLPDFRSAEHTFQLLTQVAGRAGRHHLPGKVIIQTYSPNHYAIVAAAKHDYESFYKQEIEHRRELGYPPFSKLISLMVSGIDEKKVCGVCEDLAKFLRNKLTEGVLGPAPAAISKVRGRFRYHILLKGKELDVLRKAVSETLEKVTVPAEVRVAVDVEPMGML